mgnify:CR=1 FL=1
MRRRCTAIFTQMARNGLGSIIISLILSIMEKMCFFQRLKNVSHKRYDTGIGFGLVSHYEDFEQVPELCFETYIWIELSTGDVHFEWIPITEPASGHG